MIVNLYPMEDTSSPGVFEELAGRLNRTLENHRVAFLILASALCLVTFTGYSHAKVPWIDEVCTITIARQKTFAQMWAAVKAAIETDPPFIELIDHYLFRFFGDHIFLARLPAILGFCATCVSLSIVVWRHTSAVYGAAAFFLPYATGLRVRAMDARPYGMMIGFSALALLCSDALGDETTRHRTAWRVGFTLSLICTFFSHFFSIWLLAGIGLGELYRLFIRRKIDRFTPLAVAVGLIPWVLCLPVLISGTHVYEMKEGHFHGHLAFKDLMSFYGDHVASLPFACGFLLLFAAFAVAGGRIGSTVNWKTLSPGYRAMLAASAGFFLAPLVGFAAGVVVTKVFVGYYYLIVAFGVAVGIPLTFAAFQGPLARVAGLCLFVSALGYGMFVTARGLSDFLRRDQVFPSMEELEKRIPEPHPEIVVSGPVDMLPFHEATHSRNLIYLMDPQKALQQLGSNTSDIVYKELQPYTSANIIPFDTYIASHPHYYLAVFQNGTGLDDWQFHYLLTTRHAGLLWLGKVGDVDLFRVDVQPPAAH